MEKYLVKLLLFAVPLLFTISAKAQSDSINYYHKTKIYDYPANEDSLLIKVRTLLFLEELRHAGIIVKINKSEENECDVDFSIPLPENGKINFNVVYSFYKYNYYVDLWFPKLYSPTQNKWVYFELDQKEHRIFIDEVEQFAFFLHQRYIITNFEKRKK